ncbi:MAG: CBS domain-containing protein [Spirochaetes bacterium]|nr:CBS domain-containing protein [Spirochaetota bacterium]
MKLSSLLSEENIFFGKTYPTIEQAIRETLIRMYKSHRIPMQLSEVEKAVLERQALGGTTFPTGIAVPHARLQNFSDLLIGVCVPQNPLESEGQQVRMVVVMLTSKTETTLYLNALGSFLKVSQDFSLFDALCKSGSAASFLNLLKEAQVEVKKEITVQSIMATSFPSLSRTDTVKKAADLFYQHSTSYLPVLEEGELIGELTVLDLFQIGLPDYVFKLGNVKFLKTLEPFEELLRKEEILRVEEVMKKPSLFLEEDSSIIEAVFKFVSSNRRHLPVLKGKRVVGILSYMHILHKVLRA